MTTELDKRVEHLEALAERRDNLIITQTEQLAQAHTKLTMAYAFIKLLREGYAALLHHGVNYQTLPEYQNPVDFLKVETPQEKTKAFAWLGKMISGIQAAVRRKNFTVH